ncbi:DUF3408 domain-containing protein [Alistipes ihumii]|jgi:hypothetical protein|uniref:DUF3408 domain-containing protein n=1 Tax=Alistipes TaxID=239759 RepID=UPI003A8C4EC8
MAKTVKKEDIDEKAIIASFLQDEPTEHDALVRESDADDASARPEAVREDTRRRRSREQDYETIFIREPRTVARAGKTTYIRQEFHDTIQSVCRVIGDGKVSLSGYIDNVLAHHFDTYGGEITRLYNEKHKGINILKK